MPRSNRKKKNAKIASSIPIQGGQGDDNTPLPLRRRNRQRRRQWSDSNSSSAAAATPMRELSPDRGFADENQPPNEQQSQGQFSPLPKDNDPPPIVDPVENDHDQRSAGQAINVQMASDGTQTYDRVVIPDIRRTNVMKIRRDQWRIYREAMINYDIARRGYQIFTIFSALASSMFVFLLANWLLFTSIEVVPEPEPEPEVLTTYEKWFRAVRGFFFFEQ